MALEGEKTNGTLAKVREDLTRRLGVADTKFGRKLRQLDDAKRKLDDQQTKTKNTIVIGYLDKIRRKIRDSQRELEKVVAEKQDTRDSARGNFGDEEGYGEIHIVYGSREYKNLKKEIEELIDLSNRCKDTEWYDEQGEFAASLMAKKCKCLADKGTAQENRSECGALNSSSGDRPRDTAAKKGGDKRKSRKRTRRRRRRKKYSKKSNRKLKKKSRKRKRKKRTRRRRRKR